MKKTISFILTVCFLAAALFSCADSDVRTDTGTETQITVIDTNAPGDTHEAHAAGEEKTAVPDDLQKGVNTLSVKCDEGTDNCWTFDGKTLKFSGIDSDTVCKISGDFDGNIVIDAGDDFDFELEMNGLTLFCDEKSPIAVLSGSKVTLTAKKDTRNFIYDMRKPAAEGEESLYAVYSACDLTLGGKGELTVISASNDGIRSKDDLTVKNLTLSVACADNALKGNDGVSIEKGELTLIARAGDGIKTSGSDVSPRGRQRGTVSLSGCAVYIFAACDGIDAAYNAEIGEDVVLDVYTDIYSPYSEITSVRENTEEDDAAEENHEKGSYSAKGIKAANEITVTGGKLYIRSYDDSVHAEGEIELENNERASGDVTILGGDIEIRSRDDGIHAGGKLTVLKGKIVIADCYEGIEGGTVLISGGDISVFSRDDGINASDLWNKGVTINGGNIFVFAGDDGIDSNSMVANKGIIFSGGNVTIIADSSAIDSDSGYVFTLGRVLAISGCSDRSLYLSTLCSNLKYVGAWKSLSVKEGQTLAVSVNGHFARAVRMPRDATVVAVYLSSPDAKIYVE